MPDGTPQVRGRVGSASRDGVDNWRTPYAAPAVSLPKGGGAIRGIGEKFAVSPATGTASLSIPVATTPGRSGFGPQLSLSYDSGSGKGAYGLGWSLPLASITRKTDQGVPRYRDAVDANPDVFMLSGAEDLVPVMEPAGADFTPAAKRRTLPDGSNWIVQRYRPRVEALFGRIERWTREGSGEVHWRSISRDNVTTLYGTTRESRIADPEDERRVYSWLICESYDDRGNAILYRYVPEDSVGVDVAATHERNRTTRSRSAARYLKRILYGNLTPRTADEDLRARQDWLLEVVLDYGEHDAERPTPRDTGAWLCRHDPFSAFRAGFEVRRYRLCQRILMFHHFPDEPDVGADCLVRSTDLRYRGHAPGTVDPRGDPVASCLAAVTQCGYRREGSGYVRRMLPALELDYSAAELHDELRAVDDPSLVAIPQATWNDLDGEGLDGRLLAQAGAWYYKRNLGPASASFAPVEVVTRQPAGPDDEGRRRLMDLVGDGRLDIAELDGEPLTGFYERADEQGWTAFSAFRSVVNLDWRDPGLYLMDLTGDGYADALQTTEDGMVWHPSLGEDGFAPAFRVPRPRDEEAGPRLVFADETSSVFRADASGDGLNDLVHIRNGRIVYWPNLGHGRFGARVTMDKSPWFDAADQFDPRRIRIGDFDGSGAAGIVYLGRDGAQVYRNQAGNAWGEAERLRSMPPGDGAATVELVDLLGTGTSCLVSFSALPGDARRPLTYIDLMGGVKPHLLTGVRNGMGAETEVRYAPSTAFYRRDRAAGRPWRTKLPFPVHVIERVVTHDRISGNRSVTCYAYSDGRFDEKEREFCGFGLVRQWDAQELADLGPGDPAPLETRTWFHTGAYIDGERISRQSAEDYHHDPGAMLLADTVLPAGITPNEAREVCRALRGNVLRQEVYGRDGSAVQDLPYAVTERNCAVRMLQPLAAAGHAVLLVTERESLELHYERATTAAGELDPRTMHRLTLEADQFGNVLRSASIAYGRRYDDPDPVLSEEDRRAQREARVTVTDSRYTAPLESDDLLRAPLLCETRVYELRGVATGAGQLPFADVAAAVAQASDSAHDLAYTDVDGAGAAAGAAWRRLIEHTRVLFRRDDLTGPLAFGELGELALPFEAYRLVFPAGLLDAVYQRAGAAMLPDPDATLGVECGYVRSGDDWWIPSGRFFYSPDEQDPPAVEEAQARGHFFLPRRFRDPFGNVTVIEHDAYDLLVLDTRDALGNRVTCGVRNVAGAITSNGNDYRVLAPAAMMDANRNRSQVAFNALGLVTATAVAGKPGQRLGDSLAGLDPDPPEARVRAYFEDPLADPQALLGRATTRLLYDFAVYARTHDAPVPNCPVSASLARERHDTDLAAGEQTRVMQKLTYTDGFGREVQSKSPAGGGRWVCSGWTEYNAKGDPVRRYEAFFSDTHHYEPGRTEGVSSVLVYDPLQRVVATVRPDHSWDKVEFDPWHKATWDGNDTSLIADPRADEDVGPLLARLPEELLLPTWRAQRIGGSLGARERAAAQQATAHAATPARVYLDAAEQAILIVRHNRDAAGADELLADRVRFDGEGNAREVRDARGRLVAMYDYDALGNRIRTASMDAGIRWALTDAAGRPARAWDELGRAARTTHDALGRPADTWLAVGTGAPRLVQRSIYGESRGAAAEAANQRERPIRMLDATGETVSIQFDFKGNLLESQRRLAASYRQAPDWSASPPLETRWYMTRTAYDALNRMVEQTTPDRSVIRPTHDERGLVVRVAANVRGAVAETVFLRAAAHDAKGEPVRMEMGSGVVTRHEYDAASGRLRRTRTTNGADSVQDLSYTYDPCGNVTHVVDAARQAIFFRNHRVTANATYAYDAVYRLIEATGREHVGQLASGARRPPTPTGPGDAPRAGLTHPNDGVAMAGYVERYRYDAVGNLLTLEHRSRETTQSWTRTFTYDQPSLLEAGQRGNRLGSTRTGASGTEAYTHDVHGKMTTMPHLSLMAYDHADRLAATATQVVGAGLVPQTTYYVHAADGARVLKVTDRQTDAGSAATPLRRRVYLGALEVYQELDAAGRVRLERETLHVDHHVPLALVETRTIGSDAAPGNLVRYQLTDRLHSVVAELDAQGRVITKREYHPFGSTAYEAVDRDRGAPRRYGFTGRERDDESGLIDHRSRAYAPWLARWTSPDTAGIADGPNLYLYARANPTTFVDVGGARAATPEELVTLAAMKQLEDQMNARAQKLWAPIRWLDTKLRTGTPGQAITARTNRVKLAEAISRAREGEKVVNLGTGTNYFRTPAGDLITTMPSRVQYEPESVAQAQANLAVRGSLNTPLASVLYLGADAAGASRQTKDSLALTGGAAWDVVQALGQGILAYRAQGATGRPFGFAEMQHGAYVEPTKNGPPADPNVRAEILGAAREWQAQVMTMSQRRGSQGPTGTLDFVTNTERGPVGSVVLDLLTNQISRGINQGLTPTGSVAPGLHPAVLELIAKYEQHTGGITASRYGTPGSHSELTAISNALYAREEALFGVFGQPGGVLRGTLTIGDINNMVLHNVSFQTNPHGTGNPPLCPNCRWMVPNGVLICP